YLTLIQSVALLHQYQREVKRVEHRGQVLEYIGVERADIVLANRLAHEILGRTLDEMPPQTRRLLMLIQAWVKESGQPRGEWLFTRKQLRDAVRWGDTQLKVHLSRLSELEYLLVHRRGLTFLYELLFDGEGEGAHLCGLIDVPDSDPPEMQYDAARSGSGGKRPAPGRASVGSRSGKQKQASARADKGLNGKAVGADEKAPFRQQDKSHTVTIPSSSPLTQDAHHDPASSARPDNASPECSPLHAAPACSDVAGKPGRCGLQRPDGGGLP
ncbi:Dnag primase-like protein, partial [Erwinia tracheiphila PSU-1]